MRQGSINSVHFEQDKDYSEREVRPKHDAANNNQNGLQIISTAQSGKGTRRPPCISMRMGYPSGDINEA